MKNDVFADTDYIHDVHPIIVVCVKKGHVTKKQDVRCYSQIGIV